MTNPVKNYRARTPNNQPNPIDVFIGGRIRYFRKLRHVSQVELAGSVGTTFQQVQKYENGMVQNLKIKTLRRLCEIFVVPPWQFIYPEFSSIKEKQIVMKIRQTLLLAKIYQQLSKEGQNRVYHYLRDISEIQHYKKLGEKTIKNDLEQMRKLLEHQDEPLPLDVLHITWRDITDGHAPTQETDGS